MADIVEDLLVVTRADIDRVSALLAGRRLISTSWYGQWSAASRAICLSSPKGRRRWRTPSRVRRRSSAISAPMRFELGEVRHQFWDNQRVFAARSVRQRFRVSTSWTMIGSSRPITERTIGAVSPAPSGSGSPSASGWPIDGRRRRLEHVFSLSLPMAAAVDGPSDDGRLL